MKKILSSVVLMFFAGTLNAATDAEIYHGFAKGNPDLETDVNQQLVRTAVQPGTGSRSHDVGQSVMTDNFIYHGFEKGNPDL